MMNINNYFFHTKSYNILFVIDKLIFYVILDYYSYFFYISSRVSSSKSSKFNFVSLLIYLRKGYFFILFV